MSRQQGKPTFVTEFPAEEDAVYERHQAAGLAFLPLLHKTHAHNHKDKHTHTHRTPPLTLQPKTVEVVVGGGGEEK